MLIGAELIISNSEQFQTPSETTSSPLKESPISSSNMPPHCVKSLCKVTTNSLVSRDSLLKIGFNEPKMRCPVQAFKIEYCKLLNGKNTCQKILVIKAFNTIRTKYPCANLSKVDRQQYRSIGLFHKAHFNERETIIPLLAKEFEKKKTKQNLKTKGDRDKTKFYLYDFPQGF